MKFEFKENGQPPKSTGEKIKDGAVRGMKRAVMGASLWGVTAGGFDASAAELHPKEKSAPVHNMSLEERQRGMRQEQEKMETIDSIERAKREITEHLRSPKYLKKLTGEFRGDRKRAMQEQDKRIENINTVQIVLTDQKGVEEQARRLSNDAPESRGAIGIYSPREHRLYMAYDSNQRDEVIYHELLHSITRSEESISQRAKDILSDAYLKQGFAHVFSAPEDTHFSKPSELLAGKMALERDLERLGIWKYGERFTEEQYKRMMDGFRKGKLSRPGGDFIQVIKKKHLGFVLDKIAKTEGVEEYGVS